MEKYIGLKNNSDIQEKLNEVDKYLSNLVYEKDSNVLNEFESFLKNINFPISIDLYINLVDKYKILQVLLNKEITNNVPNEIQKSYILETLIDAYYIVNGKTNIEDSLNYNLDLYLNELDGDINIEKAYLLSLPPILSEEEEKYYLRKIFEGDEKYEKKFIERNLRLSVSVALKYVKNNLELLDLAEDGNIGLIKALEKYKKMRETKYKFSTYAVWWIRQSIVRAIEKNYSIIKVPVHEQESLRRYKRDKYIIENKLGKSVENEELSKEFGWKEEKINELVKLEESIKVESLNDTIYDEDSDEKINIICADNKRSLEEEVEADILKEEIRDLFIKCNLSSKEISVLTLYFGLGNQNIHNFDLISKMLNISKENVIKFLNSALNKLRTSEFIKDFEIYVNDEVYTGKKAIKKKL